MFEYFLDSSLEWLKHMFRHLSGASDWTSVCSKFSGSLFTSAWECAVCGTGFRGCAVTHGAEGRLIAGCRKASSFWALLSVRTISQTRSPGSADEVLELFTSLTDTDSPGSKVYWEDRNVMHYNHTVCSTGTYTYTCFFVYLCKISAGSIGAKQFTLDVFLNALSDAVFMEKVNFMLGGMHIHINIMGCDF